MEFFRFNSAIFRNVAYEIDIFQHQKKRFGSQKGNWLKMTVDTKNRSLAKNDCSPFQLESERIYEKLQIAKFLGLRIITDYEIFGITLHP